MIEEKNATKISALGLGVFAAGSASAAVMQGTDLPTITDATDNAGLPESARIDIDGDGLKDFEIFVNFDSTCGSGNLGQITIKADSSTQDSYGNSITGFESSGDQYASLIAAGSMVKSGSFFSTLKNSGISRDYAGEIVSCNTPIDPTDTGPLSPTGTTRGIIGVRFARPASPFTTHYGYIGVEVRASSLELEVLTTCWNDEADADLTVGECRSEPVTVDGNPGEVSLTGAGGALADITNTSSTSVDAAPAPLPDNVEAISDIVEFEVENLAVGETIQVEVDFGSPIPAGSQLWKYDATNGWRQITPITISGSVVSYSLTDGGPNDADGVANGTIVDPVVLASGISPAVDVPVGPILPIGLGVLALGAAGINARRRKAA